MLLQEQLDRASRASEAAVFRAAEAEARIGALSAELQATRQAEQVRSCPAQCRLAMRATGTTSQYQTGLHPK